MGSDLKLDIATWDLDFKDGDLYLVDESESVQQALGQNLKLFQGEWFIDQSVGLPYIQSILDKNPSPQLLKAVFTKAILEVPGIIELLEFDLTQDTVTRTMTLSFKARTTSGEIDFSQELGV